MSFIAMDWLECDILSSTCRRLVQLRWCLDNIVLNTYGLADPTTRIDVDISNGIGSGVVMHQICLGVKVDHVSVQVFQLQTAVII